MTALVSRLFVCAVFVLPAAKAQTQRNDLPVLEPSTFTGDYLIEDVGESARAVRSSDGRELILDNGLIRRVWRLEPNAACVDFRNLTTGASMLRAVRPEAQLVLDGVSWDVGGLVGQPNHAYLTDEWLDAMTGDERAMQFEGFEVLGALSERLAWKRVRHHAPDAVWPPRGVHLRFDFAPPSDARLEGLRVAVHYEMYDDVPVMSKWIEVHNGTAGQIEVDRFTSELLAVVEHNNPVEARAGVPLSPPQTLHVETDYAFGSFNHNSAMRFSVHWTPDPEFHTQVNWLKQMPCLLRVEPTRGPDQVVAPGGVFTSFRTFELAHDSTERERRGLALRRMYRTIAPWVTENPLILHVVSTDVDVVQQAIDQAAECGFEMVSLSFGSSLNMEDDSAANHDKFALLVAYAEARGIHLGGYSLLSSRRIGSGNDVVSPEGELPTHGSCPALTSTWGLEYFAKLERFFDTTGFLQFTHDGSYPGDFDVTERLPHQRGLDDSQWAQWKVITDFYADLRARGVYVRVPDYYFLSGANECGMGYREVNWSLPRAQQVVHTRQNIFDGTWEKAPTMGWMFVPLTQYHGGGAAATIEPLDEHLPHYERMLASNLGLGVQAVYRGFRLYDTERVRDAVIRWVTWFKAHRDILESDVIHGRRADGRDVDWMLHVHPKLDERGMLVVFNPLDRDVVRSLRVPLYYTGLKEHALLSIEDGEERRVVLDRMERAVVEVKVPAGGMSWATFRVDD